jgi:cytochrome c oxidase subunit 3
MSDANNSGHGVPADGHGVPGIHYDPIAAKIGMWLFLFTEVLLFGALFIIFAVYLHDFTWQFRLGSTELNIPIGAANTVILLTSSLTMALAIAALQQDKKRLAVRFMDATVALACAFLVIKAFEWGGKFEHGLYPGSARLHDLSKGENVFYGLYFTMTGLHALHVLVGVFVILFARKRVNQDRITPDRPLFLENTGLYWHLVDLVWIYLFPLFYLIG